MHKILFVCTANIFRSRFSEEVYNHLAIQKKLSTRAFSAGLKVGAYLTRTLYKPALDKLKLFEIKALRGDDLSIHINDVELSDYKRIICLDKNEHKPMVEQNRKLKNIKVEYWDIIDEPMVSVNISLPKCFTKVEELIDQVSKDL
jgi:protein-tyrosine phosphatase